MKTLYVVYEKYYDFENQKVLAGGIQTYLTTLLPLFQKAGFVCKVYQSGLTDESITFNDIYVQNVIVDFSKGWDNIALKVFYAFKRDIDNDNDVILFASDCFMCKNNVKKSIAIQHGICWDIPIHENWPSKMNNLYVFSKVRNTYRVISRLDYVSKIVCVDYNFPNWYRASVAYPSAELHVIPNFTKIADRYEKPNGRVNIIFARRFEKYRGTHQFAYAIKRVISNYDNVFITVAGRGPDEDYLRSELSDDRVKFIQYGAGESLSAHADQHIAIIPTVGSEGTSLSLLEAMSAQCASICTDVGGMTNIVLDGYNGLITSASDGDKLYNAIKELIDNSEKRNKLANNAYETVKGAFSYEKWKEKWEELIREIEQ